MRSAGIGGDAQEVRCDGPALAFGDLASQESAQFVPVIEVELERDPVAGRFVEHGGSGLACEVHPGITPDQSIVFIGESMTIPLPDAAHGIMQCRADCVDGVDRVGVGEYGFRIDADGIDGPDALKIVAQPANRGGWTAGIQAINELGNLFCT